MTGMNVTPFAFRNAMRMRFIAIMAPIGMAVLGEVFVKSNGVVVHVFVPHFVTMNQSTKRPATLDLTLMDVTYSHTAQKSALRPLKGALIRFNLYIPELD